MTRGAQSISDEWIDKMIKCNKFVEIHDYLNASACFDNVDIKGGVNYFLYSPTYDGKCHYVLHQGLLVPEVDKYLHEAGIGIVIRDPQASTILDKILKAEPQLSNFNFSSLVSSKAYFGQDETLSSNWTGFETFQDNEHIIKCYVNKRLTPEGFGWMKESEVYRNQQTIPLHKVFIPEAGGSGDDPYVLGKPFYGEPNSVCSLTYICIGYDNNTHNFSKEECLNIISYINTRFLRFVVSIKKKNQHAPKDVYQFVPLQDFTSTSDIDWSQSVSDIDRQLYAKYGLSDEEIAFIEKMIKPME